MEGKLTRSAAVLDSETRMLGIHVDIANPVQNSRLRKSGGQWIQTESTSTEESDMIKLKPGMFGTLTILEKWDDLPIAPTTAIGTDESGNPFVMVVENVEGTDRCRKRNISIVFNDANEVGISSGVESGETVVARNVDSLSDGTHVVVDGEG